MIKFQLVLQKIIKKLMKINHFKFNNRHHLQISLKLKNMNGYFEVDIIYVHKFCIHLKRIKYFYDF